MDQVQKFHVEIVVTKFGKPVARLAPVEKKAKTGLFGFLRDQITIKGNLIAPVGERWNAEA